MSGIFGIWNLDGRPVGPETLEGMSQGLSYRGPDGSGVWIQGALGLGHRLLRTMPEQEVQPIASEDASLVLTADARLDNREELIRALKILPAHGTLTDADLILASYRSWGEACVERWIGDFAVALWDATAGTLFCARSPFGMKPLYYHHAPGRLFAFASEIEVLRALEGVPDDLDEQEVARHLLLPMGRDLAATYYDRVKRVVPAHVLVLTQDDLRTRPFWQLDPERELRLSGDAEYEEIFRETFVEAVRCRLRRVTPVASMLSGGLDSASISCIAADLLDQEGESLHTLSAVYPHVPESDERQAIEEILRGRNMEPHYFTADETNPIADYDRMTRLVGGAITGTNLYLNWELYGRAAEAGARVVLDGHPGDATVSHGIGYLAELAISGQWLKLAMTSVPYSRRQGNSALSNYLDITRTAKRHSRVASFVWRATRRLRSMRGGGDTSPDRPVDPSAVLNAEFAGRFSGQVVSDPDQPTTEREFHHRLLSGSNLPEATGWLEACAAGRGVDVRLPFCDVRLVELCLSLPADQKIRRGWTRLVLRRAMEGILPPSVQWNERKTALGPGQRRAWRTQQDGRIEGLLGQPGPLVRRFLDPERLLEMHRRFLIEDRPREESALLWRALSLALWLSSLEDPSRSGTRGLRETRPAADRPARS